MPGPWCQSAAVRGRDVTIVNKGVGGRGDGACRAVAAEEIKKVQSILVLNPPNNVKKLRHFLGII